MYNEIVEKYIKIKGNLKRFYDNVVRKPKFLYIIVGCFDAIIKDKETGIYIVPITTLKS